MRWKGLIFLIVLVAIFAVISIFFLDNWVESALEKSGELITGAKVEIDNLKISFANLSIKWDRLQVTDPDNTMKNIVETKQVAFKMNIAALFRKRRVIETMTLKDLRTGTERAYDGALPKKEKPPEPEDKEPGIIDKTKGKLKKEVENLPVMNFDLSSIKEKLNLDSLIVMADLKVVNRLDSVKADITQTSEKWQSFYKTFHPDKDLEKIKADFKDIDPKKIKNITQLLSAVEKVKSAKDNLEKILNDVSDKQKEIKSDFDRTTGYTKQVDDWFKEDYQKILNKARLPDLNVTNIGKILFGETIVNQIYKYLDYLKLVRKYMPKKSDKPKKEKPPRLAGQTVSFPDRHGWPTFLIRNIDISGQTGATDEDPGMILSGVITGITSQPWIYGKPTRIDLKALREDKPSGSFAGVLNHISDISKDSFVVSLKNVSLNNYEIHRSSYLPSKINEGTTDFNSYISFKGDDLFAEIDIKASKLKFDFSQTKTSNKFIEIVQDVINNMDEVTLNAQVSGKDDDLNFKMDSNIDNLVSNRLKSIGSQALKESQDKIRSRLNKIKQEKYNEANKLYEEKRGEIEQKIDEYRKQVEAEKSKVEEKVEEIQSEIQKRKKEEEDKLKETAKDKLKDIFKKKP